MVNGDTILGAYGTAARTIVAAVLIAMLMPGADAQKLVTAPVSADVLRIATGSGDETSYPVGAALAAAISRPAGLPPCDPDKPCGIPGLLGIAEASQNFGEVVSALAQSETETGLLPGQMAYLARCGDPASPLKAPVPDLKVIANLYTETVQLVVRRAAHITSIADLKHKRVAMPGPTSNTGITIRLLLTAGRLSAKQVTAVPVKHTSELWPSFEDGSLDAGVAITPLPDPELARLAEAGVIDILPLPTEMIARLTVDHPYFAATTLPAGSYPGIDALPTVADQVAWVERSLPGERVEALLATLWSPAAKQTLAQLAPKWRQLSPQASGQRLAAPLAQGAGSLYAKRAVPIEVLSCVSPAAPAAWH